MMSAQTERSWEMELVCVCLCVYTGHTGDGGRCVVTPERLTVQLSGVRTLLQHL